MATEIVTDTARMFGRCSTCRARFVAEVGLGPNGRPVPSEGKRMDALTESSPCTDPWGHTMTWKGLRAQTTTAECSAKCQESLHPVCACSCGGANHGAHA